MAGLQIYSYAPSIAPAPTISDYHCQNSSYNLLSLDGLQKPLKPIFISPSTDLSQVYLSNEVYSIVCLSASQCLTMDQVAVERYYVQGSADDHELWSEVSSKSKEECEVYIKSEN